MISQHEVSARATGGAFQDFSLVTHLPILVLHVHSSCNCRCVMCDIWKTSETSSLRPADLERQMDSIRALGVRWVVFTGGEPLLNREFPELCRILHQEQIHVTLLTTGLLLRKYARQVTESFDDIVVSLDGPEQIHDEIRRVPGGYALLGEGIAAVRDLSSVRITARCTVQKANFKYLRDTVAAARELALNAISFLPVDLTSHAFNRDLVWPVDRQNEIGLSPLDLSFLEAEVEALIAGNAADLPKGFIVEAPQKLRRIVRHFRAHLGLEKAQSPVCNAPWVSAVVERDGTVRPCFFHESIGNATEASLKEIINGDQAREFRNTLDVSANRTCNRCVCSLYYRP